MIQRMELEQRDFRATTVDTFKNSQENRNTMRTKKRETVRSEMKI